MVTVVTGEISQQEGLREALELVRESKDVKNGLLRIVSKEVSGKLGIFCSRYITGAQIASSGETGYAAVKKLLGVRQGMFAYVQADIAEDSSLKQSLGLDINMLLEWVETNADDEISLEAAVDSIPKGGNDSLFLMNEDDLLESSIAPASEAVEMLKSTFAGSSGGNGKSGIEDTQDNEGPSESLDSLLAGDKTDSTSKVEAQKDSLESLLEDKKKEDKAEEEKEPAAPTANEKALLDLLLDDEDQKTKAKADKVDLIGKEEPEVEALESGDVLTESVDTVGGLEEVLTDIRKEIVEETAKESEKKQEEEEEEEEEETKEEVPLAEPASEELVDKPTWSAENAVETKDEEETFDATPEDADEKPAAVTPPPVPVAPPPIDWGDEDPANPEMPSKISGNVLSKLGGGPGSRNSDSPTDQKSEEEPKLPAVPSIPKVPAHLDETQAEQIFSDLERSILRSSLPDGQGYTANQLDSIPTPKAKKGGFSATDLDAIPTPGAPNIGGDYGMAGKKPTKEESKAGIEAREYFQNESQKLAAVDPKQFLSQTGTFKKLSASELKGASEDTNPNVTIAAAAAAFLVGGIILFMGLTMLTTNPVKQHMTKGTAYLDAGKAELAVKEFTEVITAEPKNQDAVLKRAAAYMQQNSFDKAIEDYTLVLTTDKHNLAALLGRGTAYVRSRLYGDAVEDLTYVIKNTTKLVEPYKLRAIAYIQEEEYPAALRDLDQVIASGSKKDFYETYCAKADIYSRMGDFKKAASEYGRALGLEPKPEQAYLGRANAYLALGNASLAIADCDTLLKLVPGLGRAYYTRGVAYEKLNQLGRAVDDFEKAINANGSLVDAYIHRGKCYMQMNKFRYALSDFEEAEQLKPNNPEVATLIKQAKVRVPKVVAGTAIIAELSPPSAAEPKTNNLIELNSIGSKQFRSRNYTAAYLAFNKAVRIAPSDVTARRGLAHTLMNSGQAAAAAGQFAQLVNMGGTMSDRLDMAKSYLAAGYIEQAITALETLVNETDSNQARYALAQAYARAGFYEKCKMICREAIAKSRSHAETAMFERMHANPAGMAGMGAAGPGPTTTTTTTITSPPGNIPLLPPQQEGD